MRGVLRSGAGRLVNIMLLWAAVLTISWPASASAHASLVRARPAPRSAVPPPTRIDLWFNELLEDGFNSLVVIPATAVNVPPDQRANLARGGPVVDPRDRTHMWVIVEPLAAGTYVVQWRVLSRDGHSAPGKFSFRVIGSQ